MAAPWNILPKESPNDWLLHVIIYKSLHYILTTTTWTTYTTRKLKQLISEIFFLLLNKLYLSSRNCGHFLSNKMFLNQKKTGYLCKLNSIYHKKETKLNYKAINLNSRFWTISISLKHESKFQERDWQTVMSSTNPTFRFKSLENVQSINVKIGNIIY